MAKHKNALVEALSSGHPVEIQVPEDGDLASMRGVLKHGQILTLSPVIALGEIQAGDIVLVRWRGGGTILHLVQDIQGEEYLIVNGQGKINGWVHGSAILGRVTRIVDPPSAPAVPDLLERIRLAYANISERLPPGAEEIHRLVSIREDMHWYADRLGPDRWTQFPRQNKMSYRWHLWHITQEAEAESGAPIPILLLIDHAKEHVGYVAELLQLFESRA